MKNIARISIALLCVGLLFGCSKEASHQDRSSGEVVFVRANGWDLTASSISNTVMISARIAELAGKPIGEKQFPFWANRYAMASAAGLLQTHLLREEIVRRGITRSAESDASILGRYNKMIRATCASEDELSKKFGPQESAFRAQFETDSLLESFFASNSLCVVTEKDIARRYQQLSNRVVRIARIDKMAHEKADAAVKRLKAGESWEIVASNVTEDALIEESYADNWKEWGSYRLKDVESESLMVVLPTMKVGEFTKPIETDEGLVVVKILEKDDELYTLARILFRMGNPVEFPERDELVAQLKREKRVSLQRKLLPKLRERAKIEYPMGTNFVHKIWQEPELTPEQRQAKEFLKRFER